VNTFPHVILLTSVVLQLNADFTEAKDENRGKELATYETSSEDESSASSSEDGSDSGSDIVPAQKTAQRCDSISEGTDKKAAATTSPAPKRRRSAGKLNIRHFVRCDSFEASSLQQRLLL
jgi:hypothetical protein